MKKATRFLLALILVVVAAFGVMACEDKTPDDNTDETTYKIEVTCDANQGTYKLDPNQDSYKSGDEVKLTVTPKSDYELDAVKIDGKTANAESDGSYKITVGNADVKVNITFKTKGDVPPAPTTYEVTVNDEGKATVTFDEEGPYEAGKEVKFTVTPKDDNEIKSVKFNGTALTKGEDDKYTITIVAGSNVIDIEFESEEPSEPTTYTVTVNDEDKATVTFEEEGPYAAGAEVKFTVTPVDDNEIKSVKFNGTALTKGEDDKYTITIVAGSNVINIEFESEEPPAPDMSDADDYVGVWEGTMSGAGVEVTLTVTKTDTGLHGKLESTTYSTMFDSDFVKTDGVWSYVEDKFTTWTLSLNEEKTQLTLSDGASNKAVLTKSENEGVKIDSRCWGNWTWTSGDVTHNVEIDESIIKIDGTDGSDITEFPGDGSVFGYDFTWNNYSCYLKIDTPPQLQIGEDMQNLKKSETPPSPSDKVSIPEDLQGEYTGEDNSENTYTLLVEEQSITINETQVTNLEAKTINLYGFIQADGYGFKWNNYFCWFGEAYGGIQFLYESTEEMLEEEPYMITLALVSGNTTASDYLGTWTNGDDVDGINIEIEMDFAMESLQITITIIDEEGETTTGPFTATYDDEEGAYVFDMENSSGKVKLSEGKLIYTHVVDGTDEDTVELTKSEV